MDISVILVNYNTKDLTIDCLKSVYKNTAGVDFEVVVVDNASSDGSVQAIQESFPQVKIIANSKNIGFGSANNVAIKQSEAKYVFLLNTDTIMLNNAIKMFFDYMENNPKAGACGGNLFNYNKKGILSHSHSFGYLKTPGKQLLRLLGVRYLFGNKKNDQNRQQSQEVEQLIAADLMIKKSVLDEVGLFDERFFLYFEESELQFRINKAGYKIFYLPDAQIMHLEGRSSKKNKKYRRQIMTQSEYLYYRLCFSDYSKLSLRLLCSIPQLYRFFTAPDYTIKALKYVWSN